MALKNQVRILSLEQDQDGTSVVYKLQKNWILQFRLGPSLLGQTVVLQTNYPLNNGAFQRDSYQELPWQSESNNQADDTSIFANIDLKKLRDIGLRYGHSFSSF